MDAYKIGAMSIVTDTDTHSLNPILRTNPTTDAEHTKKCPVYIKDNAFIGTVSTQIRAKI